jgi:hypothetical protein
MVFMSVHGNKGTLAVQAPARKLVHLMQVDDFEALKKTFLVLEKHLKNLSVKPSKSNDDFTVTIKKWHKYQVDDSSLRVARKRGKVTVQEKEKEKEEEKEKERRTFEEDSEEFKLASLLFDTIQKKDPGRKKPNFQAWAKQVDYLLRVDKRPPGLVRRVLVWSQTHAFWQTVILSTSSLRKNFDQMLAQMQTQKGQGKTPVAEGEKYDGRK